MTDYDAIDFFRGGELIADPYPYFEWLRAQCPVQRERHHGVMMVTGYDEAIAVYNDTDTFSSCNSPTGPFPGFPVPLEGDDVNALIEQHRDELPMSDQLLTFDPPIHTAHRGLLMRLITPKRLRENEEFMWRLADTQIDEFIDRGECEFIRGYGQPFAMLVIADLLGVPESDHELFRERLRPGRREHSGTLGGTGKDDVLADNPLEFLYDQFSAYIEDRRREPRADVLSGMATATFPDGSIPEVIDVARIAANLFAAGQETSVRLFGTALQRIGDDEQLQQLLRDHREHIPNFVEECLRLESPVKGDFRLARVTTEVGGVEIPAGTTVMVVNGAANRDPRLFESPGASQVDRANARQHIAFGHGPHTCPGAPLARAEGRITIERLLDRMDNIRISEKEHGPAGARRYDYVPTYILRGVSRLYIEFEPRVSDE
ncbi:MAG TPA: cytochrome P450 [Acidimicrobiia bacterium]|nr:cytochrome P450 [Acidimicrobiia bacterium]